ncbi:MAG TPA: hypothetical protein VFP59_14335 [Candidatus Angelobacter sp.]|nr:hypothetical protein [Candidatus Angelobacter sp.]
MKNNCKFKADALKRSIIATLIFSLPMLMLTRKSSAQIVSVLKGASCSDGPVTLNATDVPLLGARCDSAGVCGPSNPFSGIEIIIVSQFTCDSTPVDNFAFSNAKVGAGITANAVATSVFFKRTVGTGFGTADCVSGESGPSFVNDPEGCSPPPPPPPPPDPTDCPSDNGDPQPICFTDCSCPSPIIVDTTGKGFHLTSASDGVLFDIKGTGNPLRMGWTTAGSGNAFLALPDSTGAVKNGTQLFGNFTPQPPSSSPNGFLALAVYDKPDHGGNNDGVIDQKDQIFSSLRLWIDDNHDGVCQPEELYKLPDLGVLSIDLTYTLSHRVDQFGNVFRYRADVNSGIPGKVSTVDRKAFDVFFTIK